MNGILAEKTGTGWIVKDAVTNRVLAVGETVNAVVMQYENGMSEEPPKINIGDNEHERV
jgi:hypothetical protein